MSDTLTYIQGQILQEVNTLGEATSAQLCSRLAHKLNETIKYKFSSITTDLAELVTKGFIEITQRFEGELQIKVNYFKLTEKGLAWVNMTPASV